MNEETVDIRLATETDAPAMRQLVHQLERESATVSFSRLTADDQQLANTLEKLNQTRSNIVLVPELNHKLVGIATVGEIASGLGEVGVAVLLDYQRFGIGSALVSDLVDWGYNYSNLQKLILDVDNNNAPASHIYHKLGFMQTVKTATKTSMEIELII